MSLKKLSDIELHETLLKLKSKEAHIVVQIISHLEEVCRRRLFAYYKCSSLYDYCIRILGYSNGEAHKKISACRLSAHCEGVKESIASGELSLSNAASVQVFMNQAAKQKDKNQPLSVLDPKQIVERVKNKSTRECEVELEIIAKENNLPVLKKETFKRRVGDKTQLRVCLDTDKLQLLKSRLGVNCEQELLGLLMDEKLKATEPSIDVQSRERNQPSRNPRSLSPSKRAHVFKRAEKKCQNCGSQHHLQIDHKLSVAHGGGNSLGNLQLLCRPCNQRAAIEQLGLATMDRYING